MSLLSRILSSTLLSTTRTLSGSAGSTIAVRTGDSRSAEDDNARAEALLVIGGSLDVLDAFGVDSFDDLDVEDFLLVAVMVTSFFFSVLSSLLSLVWLFLHSSFAWEFFQIQ